MAEYQFTRQELDALIAAAKAEAIRDLLTGEPKGEWRVYCEPLDSVNVYHVVTGTGKPLHKCEHCKCHDGYTLPYDESAFEVDWDEKKAIAVANALNALAALNKETTA